MGKYFGLGRRKSAVAQVILYGDINPKQTLESTEIVINQKSISEYFQNDTTALTSILQLFQTFGVVNKGVIKVSGGGQTGQKDAICLAIANAYRKMGFGSSLKQQNLLTQDSRVKERKKYGLKKARKAPQYSKR